MVEDPPSVPSTLIPILGDELSKCEPLEETSHMPSICDICKKGFTDPVILSCLHIFDAGCLRSHEIHDDLVPYIKCPKCNAISGGLNFLPQYDPTLASDSSVGDNETGPIVQCSVCTDGNEALYRCLQCAGTLCERCRGVHKVMKLFFDHEILVLSEDEKKDADVLKKTMQNAKPVCCILHPQYLYTSFCIQCHVPLCNACFTSEHDRHITSTLDSVSKHIESIVTTLTEDCVAKRKDLKQGMDTLHDVLLSLSSSRDRNKCSIIEAYDRWVAAIDHVKDEFMRRNRELHEDLEMKIWAKICAIGEVMDHIDYACEFSKSYVKKCSNIEMCKLTKNILACFDRLGKTSVTPDDTSCVDFKPSAYTPDDVIRHQFGTFNVEGGSESMKPAPSLKSVNSCISSFNTTCDIADELKSLNIKSGTSLNNGLSPSPHPQFSNGSTGDNLSIRSTDLRTIHSNVSVSGGSDMLISRRADPVNLDRPITNWSASHLALAHTAPHEFSSNIPVDHFLGPQILSDFAPLRQFNTVPHVDADQGVLRPKVPSHHNTTLYEYCRIRAARCSQMNLLTKWGSLGAELGRLSSPHGFCLGFDEEIVIADTFNHRIQVFTKRGEFVSFFGVSGRVDGLLWYPRKVAIIRHSQRYVVCDRGNERSRMQLFSRSGHFVRRIPIQYIEIVAGLAVDQNGHIIAIDSVSPSLFVISEEGDLLRSFDCRSYMREPSDVAIHGREYFICDFKAHCVIVLHEDGTFLRRIGGEMITDFPNGIDVSDHGDVLVGDSHGNRFHIAVFSRTGELLSEFICHQTKVTRSCCLKITSEGYVVTLARASNNVLVLDTLYVCPNGPN